MLFQSKIAFSNGFTHNNWFHTETQKSDLMYLDKDTPYYYEAFLADGGGEYEFKFGLMTDDTKYTSKDVQGALDEVQEVSVSSEYIPDVQVNEFRCCHGSLCLHLWSFQRYDIYSNFTLLYNSYNSVNLGEALFIPGTHVRLFISMNNCVSHVRW